MSLTRNAVLGLVIERPGYGYELAARLEERCPSLGYARSGVYESLNLLTREGHIRTSGERGSGETKRAAPRTIYDATDAGRDYFSQWVNERSEMPPVRDELELKIQLATPELLPELIEQALRQEEACMARLALLTGSAGADQGSVSTWRQAAGLLRRNGEIRMLQARIEWLQEMRSTMRASLQRFT